MIVIIGVYSNNDNNNNNKEDCNIEDTAKNRCKINDDVYKFIKGVRNWKRNMNSKDNSVSAAVFLNTVPDSKNDNDGVKWMNDHYTIEVMWVKEGNNNWGENWVWIKIGNPTSDYLISAINNYEVWTSENLHFST